MLYFALNISEMSNNFKYFIYNSISVFNSLKVKTHAEINPP